MSDNFKKLDELLGKDAKSADKELRLLSEMALLKILKDVKKLFDKFDGQPDMLSVRQYNRLANLQKKIVAHLKEVYKASKKIVGKKIKDHYKETYDLTRFVYDKSFKADIKVVTFSEVQRDYNKITGWIFREKIIDENGKSVWKYERSLKRSNEAAYNRIVGEIENGINKGYGFRKVASRLKRTITNEKIPHHTLTKDLLKIVSHETGKIRSVARATAYNELTKRIDGVTKIWVEPFAAKEPRPDHIALNGTKADKNGMFLLAGEKIPEPRLHSDLGQTINCHCSTRTEVKGLEPEPINFDEFDKWRETIDN